MAFFKRTKKPSQKMDDCEHLSALGADPQAWDELTDEELKQVIGVKFIEYGATQDGSLIPGRFLRVPKPSSASKPSSDPSSPSPENPSKNPPPPSSRSSKSASTRGCSMVPTAGPPEVPALADTCFMFGAKEEW